MEDLSNTVDDAFVVTEDLDTIDPTDCLFWGFSSPCVHENLLLVTADSDIKSNPYSCLNLEACTTND